MGVYLYYILKGIPNISVTGIESSCQIEQPLNRTDVEQCLKDRYLVCDNLGTYDAVISCQNGILDGSDYCFTTISQNKISASYGVPITKDYKPDSMVTFGKFICQKYEYECDNWYSLVEEKPRWYMVLDSLFNQ